MYRLNVQVTAYGRQTVPDRDVVRSTRDPLKYAGSNYITGMAKPKVIKFCTRDDISPTKEAWLWSRDCFKILPFAVMHATRRTGLSSTAELLVHVFYHRAYLYCMVAVCQPFIKLMTD